MSAQLGLALPTGTQVKLKRDGEIVTRICDKKDNKYSVYFESSIHEGMGYYMGDDEWELIEEEPKQDEELISMNSGDIIEVLVGDIWQQYEFVRVYKGDIVIYKDKCYMKCDTQWRFPPKKIDVTLQEIADWKGVEK